MKKIIILFSLVISGFALAQSDNPYIHNEPETSEMQEERAPSEPGDPNPVPIDEYIPTLFIIGIILAFVACNMKKQTEKN